MSERTTVIFGRNIGAAKRLGLGEKRDRKWYASDEEVPLIVGESKRAVEANKALWAKRRDEDEKMRDRKRMAADAQDAVATWLVNVWATAALPSGDEMAAVCAATHSEVSGWEWQHAGGGSLFSIKIDGFRFGLFTFRRGKRKGPIEAHCYEDFGLYWSHYTHLPVAASWYARRTFCGAPVVKSTQPVEP